MNIIFICKHNRFRSQLAEGFFKKINKNKKIKVSSAGIFKGFPVAASVKDVAKKNGIKLTKPKFLDEKLLVKLDTVVIVANNVPACLFDRNNIKKVIVWKIKDAKQNDKVKIEKTAQLIKSKIEKLVKELE